MKITKDTLIDFLKDNNFYEQWMEGYNIDNEIYNDIVSLDEFINKCNSPSQWFYHGLQALALLYYRPKEESDLQCRYDRWRSLNIERFIELDKQWLNYIDIYNEILNKMKNGNKKRECSRSL